VWALGIYALKAADAGALCLIGQRTPPALALPGFSGPAIGDNPIAFSCPNPNSHPIVFDVAYSVVAGGNIRIAAQEGEPIPNGWALDRAGKSTTNAKRALEGALLPFGGHKGIGIAMMVECLAGAVAASASSLYAPDRHVIPEGGAPGRQSAFFFHDKAGCLYAPQALRRIHETMDGLLFTRWGWGRSTPAATHCRP
jgi:LDH2 family malate/lactate/ureidoglycolate dehydrogenase